MITDDCTNDVYVAAEKTENGYKLCCECGVVLEVSENPVGRVLVCDIQEEDYWVVGESERVINSS
ncbi:hypothetical protein [Methanosarcina acetivorans]|uniref:hypothetical protein n=1 Tax=Methanosarcina acetivorans TaxID=2214 RepID=UPI0012FF2235|nr:hypothetical protein [Methanosarcina acetivorans]